MRKLILMLVVLLGSFANAQEANGLPTLTHVSGSNYTINGVSYTIEDTAFSGEVAGIINGTFDFNLITWPSTDGGIGIFHSAFANRTAEITGVRNGITGTLRFERIINNESRYYVAEHSASINPGNLLENLTPGTDDFYLRESDAVAAARAIVDNSWDVTVLSIWTALTRENLLILADRPDITLYEYRTVSSGNPLSNLVRRDQIGGNVFLTGADGVRRRVDSSSFTLFDNGATLETASGEYPISSFSTEARAELLRYIGATTGSHRSNSQNIFYWNNGESFRTRPYSTFTDRDARIIHMQLINGVWELQPINAGWENGSLNDYINSLNP